jgi:hypothetical protein
MRQDEKLEWALQREAEAQALSYQSEVRKLPIASPDYGLNDDTAQAKGVVPRVMIRDLMRLPSLTHRTTGTDSPP